MLVSRSCRTRGIAITRTPILDFLAPRLLGQSFPAQAFAQNQKSPPCPNFLRKQSTLHAAVAQTHPLSILDTALTVDHNAFNESLHRISIACSARDALGVWRECSSLESQGLSNLIGMSFREQTARMLVAKCKGTSLKTRWAEDERNAIEELAFFAAMSGFSEAFRQLMLRCLKIRDADAALKLYARYCERLARYESSLQVCDKDTSDEPPGHGSPLVSDLGLSIPEKMFTGSVVNPSLIIATVVIAHALKDSFHGALHAALQQPQIRVLPQHIKTVINEVGSCNDVEGKAIDYVEAISAASLAQRTESLKAHARHLAEQRRMGRLQQLADSMLAGVNGPLQWAAPDEASVSYERPVVMTDRVWAYLLRAFVNIQRDDLAEALWVKIANTTNFGSGVVMWNALLEGYRETEQLDMLLSTWQAMLGNGVEPDSNSYASKIICLFGWKKRRQALESFDEFKKKSLKDKDSLHVYNAVLNGLLLQDEGVNLATTVLDEMTAKGPKPDTISYNIFLKYYGRKGDMAKIVSIISKLVNSGATPDVVTFTTILSTMLRAGISDATHRLEQVMKTMGIELNVATYSAIIDAQVRSGTYAGIQTAWELLQKMESNVSAPPNEITYTSFLAGVHRSKELSTEQITSVVQDITRKMETRGVRIKRGAYHILMKACLENPSPDGLNHFMGYYNTMKRKHIAFSHDTWFVILRGLLARDEWALASEMVDEMLSSNFYPMWGVKEMMVKILNWRARNKLS